jgi:hypothetical protein
MNGGWGWPIGAFDEGGSSSMTVALRVHGKAGRAVGAGSALRGDARDVYS